MRTNIVIDPALMDAALKACGLRTRKQAVQEGLRLLARNAPAPSSAWRDRAAMSSGVDWPAP